MFSAPGMFLIIYGVQSDTDGKNGSVFIIIGPIIIVAGVVLLITAIVSCSLDYCHKHPDLEPIYVIDNDVDMMAPPSLEETEQDYQLSLGDMALSNADESGIDIATPGVKPMEQSEDEILQKNMKCHSETFDGDLGDHILRDPTFARY